LFEFDEAKTILLDFSELRPVPTEHEILCTWLSWPSKPKLISLA